MNLTRFSNRFSGQNIKSNLDKDKDVKNQPTLNIADKRNDMEKLEAQVQEKRKQRIIQRNGQSVVQTGSGANGRISAPTQGQILNQGTNIEGRVNMNSDGTALVTQTTQGLKLSQLKKQNQLGDTNQQPTPSTSFTSTKVDNTKKEPEVDTANDDNLLTSGRFSTQELDSQINLDLTKAKEGAKYFGVVDNLDLPDSMKDLIKERVDLENAVHDFELESLQYTSEEELRTLKRLEEQFAGQKGLNNVNMSQSREGVQSASMANVRSETNTMINKELEAATKAYARNLEQAGLLRRQIEFAKKEGHFELASSLSDRLSLAEEALHNNKMKAIEGNKMLLDMQMKRSQEMRTNIQTFSSMIQLGQQFDTQGLLSISQGLGLPAEIVMSTYQSYDQIRNDKSMDQQQKALKLNEVSRQFTLAAQGYETSQQRSAKIFTDMYQSGKIDKQQLGEMMQIAGIDSMYNPITQVELAVQQARLQIDQRKLNGQPVGFSEMREYYDRQIELMDLNGELMAYQPTQSLEGISTSYQNGELVFDLTNMEDRHWECGEFVNRTWGLSSGGSGGFASLYSDKLNNIDIPADMVNEMNFMQTIRPGMAFVMPANGQAEQWGHVGIVTKVYPDGTFDTMEANYPGDKVKANVVSKTRSIADVDGFTKPPVDKAKPVGGQKAIQEDINASQAVVFNAYDGKKIPDTWQGSPEEFQQQYQKFLDIQSDPKTDLSTVIKMSAGGKPMNDKPEQKMESFSTVANNLQLLEESLQNIDSDKLAPVLGLLEQGNPWDTDRVLVDNAITSIVPGLARGVYGEVGVLTDADVERYRKLLPTYRNTEQQRELVLDMLKTSLYQGVKSTVRTQAANGKDVSRYTYLVDYVKPQDQLQAPNDLDIYSQIETGQFDISQDPQFTSELDSALNSIFE